MEMNPLQIQETWDRLTILLSSADVPEQRKSDLNWLSRNLGINNSGPDIDEALMLIHKLRADITKTLKILSKEASDAQLRNEVFPGFQDASQ